MALLNLICSYVRGELAGFFEFLNHLNEDVIGGWAERLNINEPLALILCLAAVALLGLLAYRYLKLFTALGMGFVGFFLGRRLFEVVRTEWMEDWMIWGVAALCALVLLALAFNRSTYVVYSAMVLLGYCFVRFYLTDHFWLALGGALVVALLMVSFFRFCFIMISGFFCGILATSFLFALLPEVEVLEYKLFALESGPVFWALALILTAVFVAAQFAINRRRRKA